MSESSIFGYIITVTDGKSMSSNKGRAKSASKVTKKKPSYAELERELTDLKELRVQYDRGENQNFLKDLYEETSKKKDDRIKELEEQLASQGQSTSQGGGEAIQQKPPDDQLIQNLRIELNTWKEKVIKYQEVETEWEAERKRWQKTETQLTEKLQEVTSMHERDIREMIKTKEFVHGTHKPTDLQAIAVQQKPDDRLIQELRTELDTMKGKAEDTQQLKKKMQSLQTDKETAVQQKLADDRLIQELRTELDTMKEKVETDSNPNPPSENVKDGFVMVDSSDDLVRKEVENKWKEEVRKKDSTLNSVQTENKSLQAKVQEMESDIKKVVKEKEMLQIQVQDFQNLKKEYSDLKKEKANMEKELTSQLSNANMKAFDSLEKKENEMKALVQEKKEMKTKIDRLASDNRELEKTNKSLDEKVDRLMTQMGAAASDRNLQNELQKLKQEKETLLNRLSKMAGAQLTVGNPNIADLGDANRPTKIGEKFTELYDNEWTDAFEELELLKKSETECISLLLKLLIEAQKFCSEEFGGYKARIEHSMKCLPSSESPIVENLSVEMRKQIADFCKSVALSSVEIVQKSFLEKRGKQGKEVTRYIKQCVMLCWLMRVQDPPVLIDKWDPARSSNFNTDLYKHYTKSGEKMDFVVWPPLYLHKGGSLLAKGCSTSLTNVILSSVSKLSTLLLSLMVEVCRRTKED
ncbi:hypothetical protein ScPMuIL_010031 [Solemya velum]